MGSFPLYGLDRDELECWNVREMANPHLPFPRVYTVHTQRRKGEGVEGWRALRRREGRKGYKEGREERRKTRREAEERRALARAQGLCVSSPLRCRCLPCSFPRSSINETRVQSRRMSNKYVSRLHR